MNQNNPEQKKLLRKIFWGLLYMVLFIVVIMLLFKGYQAIKPYGYILKYVLPALIFYILLDKYFPFWKKKDDPTKNPADAVKPKDGKKDKDKVYKPTPPDILSLLAGLAFIVFITIMVQAHKDRESEKNRAPDTHTTAPSTMTSDPFWEALPKIDLMQDTTTVVMSEDEPFGFIKDMVKNPYYFPPEGDTVTFTCRYYPNKKVYSKWKAVLVGNTLRYHMITPFPETSLTGKYTLETDKTAKVFIITDNSEMRSYVVKEF